MKQHRKAESTLISPDKPSEFDFTGNYRQKSDNLKKPASANSTFESPTLLRKVSVVQSFSVSPQT